MPSKPHSPSPQPANREGGSALVVVIFVIMVLALLLAALAYINSGSNQNTAYQIASTRAYWAAQSGAEWGVWQGENGSCAPSTTLTYSIYSPNAGLSGCQATVACLSSSASSIFYYQINSTGVCTAGNLGTGNSPIPATRSIAVGWASQNNACQQCTSNCINTNCFTSIFGTVCSRNGLINCAQNNCSISPSKTNSCINTNCFNFFGTWFCDINGLGTCLAGDCTSSAGGAATAATLSYWLESP